MSTPVNDITAADIREHFDYNPATGELIRLKKTNGKGTIGAPVGSKAINGYLYLGFNGRKYLVHRLVWLWNFGKWPDNQIDHINRDRADNRINNLRDVTNSENQVNARRKARGYSKRTDKKARPYAAYLRVNGKRKHLGFFATPSEARAIYLAAFEEKYNQLHRELTALRKCPGDRCA